MSSFKLDPEKIIKVNPIVIKEGQSQKIKTERTSLFEPAPKGFWQGVIIGIMMSTLFYAFMDAFNINIFR